MSLHPPIQWVLDHSRSTGAARLVMFALAYRCDRIGRDAHPGQTRLRREAGGNERPLAENTLTKAIRALEELGEIVVYPRAGGNKNTPKDKKTNRYDLPHTPGYQAPEHLTPRRRDPHQSEGGQSEGSLSSPPSLPEPSPPQSATTPPPPEVPPNSPEHPFEVTNTPRVNTKGAVDNSGGSEDNQGALTAIAFAKCPWLDHATPGERNSIAEAITKRAAVLGHPPETVARWLAANLAEANPPAGGITHPAGFVRQRLTRIAATPVTTARGHTEPCPLPPYIPHGETPMHTPITRDGIERARREIAAS